MLRLTRLPQANAVAVECALPPALIKRSAFPLQDIRRAAARQRRDAQCSSRRVMPMRAAAVCAACNANAGGARASAPHLYCQRHTQGEIQFTAALRRVNAKRLAAGGRRRAAALQVVIAAGVVAAAVEGEGELQVVVFFQVPVWELGCKEKSVTCDV
jgi:hypothetical protein